MRNAHLFKLALAILTLTMLATVLAFTRGAEPTPTDQWQWLKLKGEPARPAIVIPPTILPAVEKPAPKPAPVKVRPSRRGYPVRGSWWSGCSSWRHLTTGEHAGKFDAAWLQTLSNAEIQSLHSDAHEGRVKWQFAVRAKAAPARSGHYETRRQCVTDWRGRKTCQTVRVWVWD